MASDGEDRAREGGSASASSEAAPSPATTPATTGTADLGPLCPADFKVSAGATRVCKEVTHFAAPSYARELFRKMSLKEMFRSMEANAAKVGL